MYSLEVYGLTKRYGKTTAVKNVNFAVRPGESLAVLGPAESGKTTLVRLISGLEEVDQGHVVINGEDVTDVPAFERHVGVVGQSSYGLLSHLSVFESLAMPLHPSFTSKEIKEGMGRQRILMVAQNLRIQHLLERKVSVLSEGDRLRVAIARGLVKKPQLYLFDESLLQLATPTRLEARREIIELHRTTQIPYVYMTRDQPEAFALADRIVVINKGEIQQIGARAELFNTPATLWVARWLGFPPMNTISGYLQGTYKDDGIHYRVWSKSISPLLPAQWTQMLESVKRQNIFVGIRPEDIIPEWELQEKWKPSLYAVKVEILASEWNQGNTLAQLQLPHIDDKFMAVFDVPHGHIKIGQIMTIGLDPEKFCLFHPDTQQLLHAPPVVFGVRKNTNTFKSGSLLKNYRIKRPE
jgi:ABC-type sugar transport system ATPase subunit